MTADGKGSPLSRVAATREGRILHEDGVQRRLLRVFHPGTRRTWTHRAEDRPRGGGWLEKAVCHGDVLGDDQD